MGLIVLESIKRNRLSWMRAARSRFQAGHLGDVAAYKSAILGVRAYPEVTRKLDDLEDCLPVISLPPLRSLPQGTFGRTYARHMDANHLTPLSVSPEVAAELAPFALGLRYSLTHDIFHVLLGCDVSWAGEMGVWSFVGAQQYSRHYEWAATCARILYPMWAPGQRRAIQESDRRSQRLARQAPCLIAIAFEQYWDYSLQEVRSQFGLLEA